MRNDDTGQNTGTVRVSGYLKCASEAEAEILRAHLPEHVRLTRAEPGCLSFEARATDDPMVWRLDEEFTDAAAFKAHQARTRDSEWARVSAAIARDIQVSTGG
ncbi:Antibiotic biosynthesis monooxygenase [Paracoccus halophilus]|uniref:Antibiotic biosynthesis monooxygenase n=1 Tax=Paracoccus halophilus TaxID=376733 RepID=A0A099F539_9RHOB|nr:antibiotic biosynthesis monooxygenase [Paracoccus halophilus]KGJ05336.1 antibiotic biosynthesis monooxygenase [Paracoccus halophilus]SFA48731.1 Antibiotic biosynthesis monooxygenase [Paracoccus halophilus]